MSLENQPTDSTPVFTVVQADQTPEVLEQITVETLVFRGKPGQMKVDFLIQNNGDQDVMLNELPFQHSKRLETMGFPSCMRVNLVIPAGKSQRKKVRLKLPNNIPAGKYTSYLLVGSQKEKVYFQVIDDLQLDLFPREFITQGVSANKEYIFQMEVQNKGNMAYIIPKLNHSLVLDSQYECKARSWSTRHDAAEGMQAFTDGIAKRVQSNLSGWVKIQLAETGQTVAPGESLALNLSLTLPKDVNINASYSGEIVVVGNQIIKYQILA